MTLQDEPDWRGVVLRVEKIEFRERRTNPPPQPWLLPERGQYWVAV